MAARFIVADVFDGLATLPDNSVDLVMSSPPFLALRSYLPADHPDKGKEIGSEATPADFLDTLLDVVEACDRVLAPHGSLVFELGDTFSGSGGAGGDYGPAGLRDGQTPFDGSAARTRSNRPAQYGTDTGPPRRTITADWPLEKSLCGIPTLFAWSLAYGRNLLRPERTTPPWRIRNLIAWCRPNPPVGALGDKVRPATSYLTVATKARDRYFDLDAERTPSDYDRPNLRGNGSRGPGEAVPGQKRNGSDHTVNPAGAPLLDHWNIPTQSYRGSHYATFPMELPRRVISLMCPREVCQVCGEPRRRIVDRSRITDADDSQRVKHANGERPAAGRMGRAPEIGWEYERTTLGWTDCGHGDYRRGVVLDPFAGSGTTLAVASGMGRDSVGIDLDARNASLARDRVGMFLDVTDAREVVETAERLLGAES